MFVSARHMEWPGIRAGLWLPPPKNFETSDEAESCGPRKQDNAWLPKSQNFDFFREAGDVEPFDGSFCLFAVSSCEFLVPSTVTYFPLRVSPTQLADCRA